MEGEKKGWGGTEPIFWAELPPDGVKTYERETALPSCQRQSFSRCASVRPSHMCPSETCLARKSCKGGGEESGNGSRKRKAMAEGAGGAKGSGQ